MHQSNINIINPDHQINERKTWRVFVVTFVMMIVEIASGFITGSMALLADGWHMGTHAAAFGITIFAYRYARRNHNNQSFSFGPGKVTTLGGFASAVALAVVALFMIIESIERLFNPVTIQFNEAIFVAILGLGVNIISAILLMGTNIENHTHGHNHDDHNLRSAYFHVLADALTSLLAIAALLMGKYLGWQAMDPAIGIIGALIILNWSRVLIKSSAGILLDRAAGDPIAEQIRETINDITTIQITDLKLWYLTSNRYAAVIRIKDTDPLSLNECKQQLARFPELLYTSIEQHYDE